jgi:poly(A) polymerase
VAPSFLLACLLWHDVLDGWTERREAGEHTVPALQAAVDAVFDARIGDVSGRGKLGADMREIWMMQPRLERRQPNTAYSMIEQPRFRAGFDFLRLRADVGEVAAELADWWEDFSLGSDEDREALLNAIREAQRQPPRRVPKAAAKPAQPAAEAGEGSDEGTADAADGDAEGAEHEPGDEAAGGNAPARKRRRRRRKPAGGAQGGGQGGGEGGASAPASGGDAG